MKVVEKIAELVRKSHEARKKSKELLEEAKLLPKKNLSKKTKAPIASALVQSEGKKRRKRNKL